MAAEVSKLEAKGVKFVTDAISRQSPYTVDELMKEEGFESVFIGTGAGLPCLYEYSGRKSARRMLRQRISDPYQSDEGLSAGI